MSLHANDVENEIRRQMDDARNKGLTELQINSRELHIKLGGYPGKNHRMPTVCNVMDRLMTGRDKVISAPPLGKGARKTNLYYL